MIELFDVQTGFGGSKPGMRSPPTEAEWLSAMKRFSIGRALVRTLPPDMDRDVATANEALYGASEASPSLIPCPTLLPAGAGDVPPEDEQAAGLIERGSGAAFLRPGQDGWSLADWASGDLFRALAARRVPAVCEAGAFGLDAVAELARRHVRLPFILVAVHRNFHRNLFALLEAFGNIHLSTGSPASLHGGLEQLVSRFGPERFLFGTGFPEADPMPAITMLTYAEISQEQRALIGAQNLERLIGEIVR